jgi:hypothetical protein
LKLPFHTPNPSQHAIRLLADLLLDRTPFILPKPFEASAQSGHDPIEIGGEAVRIEMLGG